MPDRLEARPTPDYRFDFRGGVVTCWPEYCEADASRESDEPAGTEWVCHFERDRFVIRGKDGEVLTLGRVRELFSQAYRRRYGPT